MDGGARRPTPDQNNSSYQGWQSGLWLVLLVAVLWIWFGGAFGPRGEQITYTEFKRAVRGGEVESVTFSGQSVTGVYAQQATAPATSEGAPEAAGEAPPRFSTTVPPVGDDELLDLLEEHGVEITATSEASGWWWRTLLLMLPWVLIIGLIYYSTRRVQSGMGQGGAGGLFGIGRSKAKRFRKDKVAATFDDVAGAENAKGDLHEIVEYLKRTDEYRRLGAKIPKGILLMGPPGTGKTLLAKAVAGEADVPFYSISGSEFIEMFVGVGAARVRDMFENARKESPAIIFIDEIDSVGRARGTGVGGGHDEREQTLNQILGEMDGFEPHEAVVVLAATNRPDVLDPALTRPGRFDRKVTLELPQRQARRQILEVHTRDMPLAGDVDLGAVAGKTVGMSGADLENLVNEAALLAGREHKEKVDMAAFDLARDKIVLGAKREGLIGEEEKKIIAYHESGHALAAKLLPHTDPVEKVTIIARGRALGATEQTPEEERHHTMQRSYLESRIGVMLAGRVAERLAFGEVSTGAENDLTQATRLARRMVSRWGMSERLGAATFTQGEEQVFLGRELTQQREFSERTAAVIDEEVQRVIAEIEQRVERLLGEHRERLDALVAKLLQEETVSAGDINQLLNEAPAGEEAAARDTG